MVLISSDLLVFAQQKDPKHAPPNDPSAAWVREQVAAAFTFQEFHVFPETKSISKEDKLVLSPL